ncbi:secreted RxLR effector protein 161-like [Apium graveolens]|uniref:secreted RxLR effector protein 161-like n=1 Tax=Apium graveolens TaxID=4045 RepID=UPI003D7B9491
MDATYYRSVIGGLRYLVHTRPDIAYSVGIASRYVQGTLKYGLVYTRISGNNVVTGYTDSDLAGNLDDRRSTGGKCFYLNESLVIWVSQKQRCVALSSCEAEFMAATSAACEAIWVRNLLNQITGECTGPVVLFVDNKSAIDLAKNVVFHGRSKYIHVRYHFIRECVERGDIILKHVNSDE